MSIKKLTPLVAMAAIATIFSFTACKKSNTSSDKEGNEIMRRQSVSKDIQKQICAFDGGWKVESILADKPVDVFKKGATKDIYSQRPACQSDDHFDITYQEKGYPKAVVSFNALKYIDEKYPDYNTDTELVEFEVDHNPDNSTTIRAPKMFGDESYMKNVTYKMESLKNNKLHLSYEDKALETTIRVVLIGKKK